MKNLNRPRRPLAGEDSPLVRRRTTGNGVGNGGLPLEDLLDLEQAQDESPNKYSAKRNRRRNGFRSFVISPVAILLIVNFCLICFLLIKARLSRQCPYRAGEKPIVEFYIHGRGSGHWTGSLGLMEVLMDNDYKVLVHATSPIPSVTDTDYSSVILDILKERVPRETVIPSPPSVNYTIVDDLLPGKSWGAIFQILWKRVPRSRQLERPLLMVSDGDFPAAVQSYLYGIPSLYTTHGQMFVSNSPPSDLPPRLTQSWKCEARTNGANAMWTSHELGFNHVPLYESVRPRIRNSVRKMAHQRAARMEAFQGGGELLGRNNKLVVTYFRDANGQKAVQWLLQNGLDVVVHGFVPKVEEETIKGRLIPVDDMTLFVQFMSVADGIVASGGCILQAECVYASIPLFALYGADDTEHELNVYMSQQWAPPSGIRKISGMSFEDLDSYDMTAGTNNILPTEMQTFLDRIQASEASASFYALHEGKHDDYSSFVFHNEDLEGTKEHADIVLEILEQVKQTSGC